MPYTEQEIQRLRELYMAVEKRKEHPNAAPTFRDSPALRETAEIILSREDCDIEALENKIEVLSYLSECYYSMGRPALSAVYLGTEIACHVALLKQRAYSEKEQKAFEYAFFMGVKTRNYYEGDDCADLFRAVQGTLPEEKAAELYQNGVNARKGLPKDDPVEKTEAYLAVIDEVEEWVDAHKTMDFCLEYWSLKKEALAKRGIHWQSPALLNPGFMFD